MSTTMTPEQIAAKLTEADRECLLDLAASKHPWLMGAPESRDYDSRMKFYDNNLLEARFPEARSGDSGRQFWVFNETGLAVRAIIEKEAAQ